MKTCADVSESSHLVTLSVAVTSFVTVREMMSRNCHIPGLLLVATIILENNVVFFVL